eukprot:c17377_g1_i2.p1 GENE.c17377_g1_i2~~c17377_g1_i2.p1  ORF type:complete len:411 (+),score=74.27 c17377_g1_i2:115-1233(+)
MFMGSAFQKVFSTLVIFFHLVQKAQEHQRQVRYFLVEELEVQLYPVLAVRFFDMLLHLGKDHRVRVVTTTHSPSIVTRAEASLPLKSAKRCDLGNVLVDMTASRDKPVILVEGPSDAIFLKRILSAATLEKVEITVATDMFPNSKTDARAATVRLLRHRSPSAIVSLEDPDFFPRNDLLQKMYPGCPHLFHSCPKTCIGPVPRVFWTMPAIESFLIEQAFLADWQEMKPIVQQYFADPKNHQTFWHGVHNALSKHDTSQFQPHEFTGTTLDLFTAASTQLDEQTPDVSLILRAIQGHDFVKLWSTCINRKHQLSPQDSAEDKLPKRVSSNPCDFVKEYPTFQDLHDSIKQTIEQTIGQVAGALRVTLDICWS